MKILKIQSNHYPSPTDDDIFTHWKKDINSIYKEWTYLYSDYIYFRNVAKGIDDTSNHDFFYIAYRYYSQSLCLAVRKSVDQNQKSISLIIILSSMYIHNEMFTKSKSFLGNNIKEHYENMFKVKWNSFTEETNRKYISKSIIHSKTEQLISLVNPIKMLTNTSIAHSSKKKIPEQIVAKYNDLWKAANFIIGLLKDLNLLLNISSPSLDKSHRFYSYTDFNNPQFSEKHEPATLESEKFEHIVL